MTITCISCFKSCRPRWGYFCEACRSETTDFNGKAVVSENSDAIVAQLLFNSLGEGVKNRVRRGGPEADHDLNLTAQGYAPGVRAELIKMLKPEG